MFSLFEIQILLTKMHRIKKYIIDSYSKFWLTQVLEYGYSDYHKAVISIIDTKEEGIVHKSQKILECCIGTGYPIAIELAKRGYELYGVDIAPALIRKCKENTENDKLNIKCVVGDAESLPYKNSAFNLTYCLQSTWYFTDIGKAIEELFRVTNSGGKIIFDIQNLWNYKLLKRYLRRRVFYLLKVAKRKATNRS
ncbi:MAG: class I SAM-dependent methyltransferase, partial [Candidatus Stahlbacteria bacterium]|nr:class I SAM-dependent methyltransferase [Candidatus Stahlbacteria bacterium]